MKNVFTLKITLKRTKPPIWRRLVVPENITFYDLHLILQEGMGWHNSHLFSFDLGDFSIEVPFDDDFGGFKEIKDARKVKINKYFYAVGDKMGYVYDFGDSWEHKITLEKIEPATIGSQYPICIKGKGNCPPEDCGGVWGFEELKEIIKDENHEGHDDMIEWLGEGYDPDSFDIDAVNARLGVE